MWAEGCTLLPGDEDSSLLSSNTHAEIIAGKKTLKVHGDIKPGKTIKKNQNARCRLVQASATYRLHSCCCCLPSQVFTGGGKC